MSGRGRGGGGKGKGTPAEQNKHFKRGPDVATEDLQEAAAEGDKGMDE